MPFPQGRRDERVRVWEDSEHLVPQNESPQNWVPFRLWKCKACRSKQCGGELAPAPGRGQRVPVEKELVRVKSPQSLLSTDVGLSSGDGEAAARAFWSSE